MAFKSKYISGRQPGYGAIKQLGKDMRIKNVLQGKLPHINKKEREEIVKVATQVFAKNGKDPYKIEKRKFEAEVLRPLAVGRYDRLSRQEIAEIGNEFGLTGYTNRIGSKYFDAKMKEQREKFKKSIEPKIEQKTLSRKEAFNTKDFHNKLAERTAQIIEKRNRLCALGMTENNNTLPTADGSDIKKATSEKKPATARYQTETFTGRDTAELKSGGLKRKGKSLSKTPISNIQVKGFNKPRPGMSFTAYNARPYKEPPLRPEVHIEDLPEFKGLAFGERSNLNASNENLEPDKISKEDDWNKYEAYQTGEPESTNDELNEKDSGLGGAANDSFGQNDRKNN